MKTLRTFSLYFFAVLVFASACVRSSETPAFSIRSIADGAWSDAATWEPHRVPRDGEHVLIARKTRVVFDAENSAVIRYLQVAGTLTFSREKSSTLNVGIVTIQSTDAYAETGFDCAAHNPGPSDTKDHGALRASNAGGTPAVQAGGERAALEAGTLDAPIPQAVTARIRLHYLPGMDKNDGPALVCCGGRMDFHGAPMSRTWLHLGRIAAAGSSEIVLSEPVTGWRVGDEILITGSSYKEGARLRNAADSPSETRHIAKIDGTSIQLDAPLKQTHAGGGEFSAEAANLSRNVVVESADPDGVRGHTMYHKRSEGGISYARFAFLGKEGVLGRYAIHYHLCGATMRGSSVIGVAIVDSLNRWVTIHGTQYLVVRDCVGYKSVGHGFFLEDATEEYNLLDRNLGVQAYSGKRLPKQVLPFDPNEGSGFWWANGRNSFTRNVAVENEEYGFRYDCQKTSSFDSVLPVLMPDGSKKDVDVRTIPFFRFEDNEAHGNFNGMVIANNGNSQPDSPIENERQLKEIKSIDWTGPDSHHPHIINKMKIWETHYAMRPHCPSMLIENIRIDHVAYGIYRPAFDNHVYRNLHLSHAGAEPFNRGMDDASAQVGPITVDGLTFENCPEGDQRHPMVHMSDLNLYGNAECHFRNVVADLIQKRRPVFNRGGSVRVDPIIDGVPYYIHDYFGPGRDAKIVSTKAADLLKDGNTYKALPPLTGDESVVAEVKGVKWPELLDIVDDMPPATIMTSARVEGGKVIVRGVTHDNGVVASVSVNGQLAKLTAIQPGVVDWEIELDAPQDGRITAFGTDEAGNRETMAHVAKVSGGRVANAQR
ncbi:MAG TPA: G8 domain-containing protein [Planctomycetota bacterium]|nr:G8 domain-containing protein [Planctomycetota bacterium]